MPTLAVPRLAVVATILVTAAATSPASSPEPRDVRGWSTWSEWAGSEALVTGTPSMARVGDHLEVFARAADGALLRRTGGKSGWGAWTSLGGDLASEPIAVRVGDRVEVYYRGADGAAWLAAVDGSGVKWSSLGGVLASSVAVAAGPDRDDVSLLVVGTDGHAWGNERRSGAWSGWLQQGDTGVGGAQSGEVRDTPAGACPTGLTRCGDECVDVRSDARHCGRCGRPCATGSCAYGTCAGEVTP